MAKAKEVKYDRAALIRKIWGIGKTDLQLTEEDLRAAAFSVTGKDSLRQCSDHELYQVLCHLGRLKDRMNTQPGKITPQQLWKIREYERRLGWTENPKRLRAFMAKYSSAEQPEWLSFEDAKALIESLKKVYQRELRKAKVSQENLQRSLKT
jgi:hypothetical protein